MIKPHSGGLCRYCEHSVDDRHVGSWCADCQETGAVCGAAKVLEARQHERTGVRVTR